MRRRQDDLGGANRVLAARALQARAQSGAEEETMPGASPNSRRSRFRGRFSSDASMSQSSRSGGRSFKHAALSLMHSRRRSSAHEISARIRNLSLNPAGEASMSRRMADVGSGTPSPGSGPGGEAPGAGATPSSRPITGIRP
eukprot:2515714-Rhodomonas_salina.1